MIAFVIAVLCGLLVIGQHSNVTDNTPATVRGGQRQTNQTRPTNRIRRYPTEPTPIPMASSTKYHDLPPPTQTRRLFTPQQQSQVPEYPCQQPPPTTRVVATTHFSSSISLQTPPSPLQTEFVLTRAAFLWPATPATRSRLPIAYGFSNSANSTTVWRSCLGRRQGRK